MQTRLFAAIILLTAFIPILSFAQAVVRNGDVFELQLSGMPAEYANEFHLNFTVGDDGEVSIPVIGQIKASGITTTQLSRNIESRLKAGKIFTMPTAVITLQAQSRFVTVGGAVRAPQAVLWNNDMNLNNAITRAGGFGEFPNKKKIKLTREGRAQFFNLTRVDKDPTQNPRLLPGDEIEVPE